jgi:DNA-binding winged helix-turn-helix (wHTH) protein
VQRIVILSTSEDAEYINSLSCMISSPRVAVHSIDLTASLGESAERLEAVTSGKIPGLIIVDLSGTTDCLLLEEARRLYRYVWGDDSPSAPTIGILTPEHLKQPEWPAYIDDFVLVRQISSELPARVKQLLFRANQKSIDQTIGFADVKIESATGRVRSANTGQPISLTPREADLLGFLVQHRGKFFARDRLLDLVWGVGFEGGERTVDIHIRRLRSKLPPLASELLETRRGVGYGFRLPE